jgi:hypothetical protein
MDQTINRLIAGTFGLIMLFLLLSRSSDFTSIISSVGGFVTNQTQALQGVGNTSYLGLIGAPSTTNSAVTNAALQAAQAF